MLLCSLCTVGPASAGVVSPDTVAASAPQWVGDHVIAFEYSRSSYVGRWHEVRDDGTGFAPTAAPPPDGGPTGAVARGTKLYGSDGRLLVSDASPQFGFAVSPDGSQIVFAAWSGWGNQRGAALYVASTSGADANIRRLTPDVCTVAQFAHTVGSLCLDVIRTGAGEDSIFPGPGRDVVGAGRDPDHVIANDGERDVIDCGPGDDRARADRVDVVRNCEHVTVVS